MKPKALVWFTGVISKYSMNPVYNISELQINYETLYKIQEDYDIIFLICTTGPEETEAYREMLKEKNLTSCQVLFLNYEYDMDRLMTSVLESEPRITTYIDYSKSRLKQAGNYLKNNNLIHISQYLN